MPAATLGASNELLQMKSFFLDRSSPVWADRHCISSAIVIILGNLNVDSDVSNPVLNSRRISQNSPFPQCHSSDHITALGKSPELCIPTNIVNNRRICAKFQHFGSEERPRSPDGALQQAKQNPPIFPLFSAQ